MALPKSIKVLWQIFKYGHVPSVGYFSLTKIEQPGGGE